MYAFNYVKPASLADAAAALSGAEDGAFLAGGQTLLPTLKQRLASPSDLVDLGGIAELQGIRLEGRDVVVGAMTRHAAVAASAEIKGNIPALAALAGGIGDQAVRNRGTIGGSVANNDPAADYPAAVLGLGATVVTDRREIAADDFFTGLFETALQPGEIITAVRFPQPEKAAYVKFPNPASRYAMVGVFVAKTAGGVRVAVTGAGSGGVFRVPAYEEALAANFAADAVADGAVAAADLNSDLHADADYRAHLIGVMTRRAVAAAG
ncbi:MAG: xanthine dehydrogenase family protein subunit M [Alphaproteobacteria bacterium]|nr:xanthine dehydrogenase family protein subunit M [Alphaproteobacteria bacterium]MCB9927876.1 xanthine dehydrogenase family protein subunit M [Alphaproteobacteria bacterium]